ncbi:hypothetical protein [Pseudoduganella namucuonensis]|uniref:Transporter substrate-binding domain-containing protein n=1 Tax=Pseudoduganella namucuonensis TaxID=1035707 RepID=A0A1I7KMU1_9BURK|nr:hypothetical protein [Pseudoduganella namucuonensis]SFU98762.1 hypothetical protein SAMN05216552_101824 [Pseudoduganella namucuonensis]
MRCRLLMVFLALFLRHHYAGAESYHCVSFEYPPLISLAPGGAEPSGFAVELVKRVFQQLGATAEYRHLLEKYRLEPAPPR